MRRSRRQSDQSVPRSAAQLTWAVQEIAKFGNKVREECAQALAWVLQWAALTVPGAFAQKITKVPLQATEEKTSSLQKPAAGKRLVALLVVEVHGLHNIRQKKAAEPAAPSAFVPLTFSDSEGETAEAAPAGKKRKLQKIEESADQALAGFIAEHGRSSSVPVRHDRLYRSSEPAVHMRAGTRGSMNAGDGREMMTSLRTDRPTQSTR